MKRGLWFVLGIVGALMAIFLFFPGAKSKRIDQIDRAILGIIAPGRKLTKDEFELLKKAKPILVQDTTYKKAASVYLFIPSLNTNIAVLARTGGYPSLESYKLNVFPVSELESPTSEHAISMCLLPGSPWTVEHLKKASANILPSASKIEEAWKSLKPDQKLQIKKGIAENESLSKSLGNFNVIVVKNEFAYGMDDWRKASDIAGEISQLD